MRIMVCGLSGRLVGPALDRLDELLGGIDEVSFGVSQRATGVDVAASAWVDLKRRRFRLYRFDRRGDYMLACNPHLILMAIGTGRPMAWVCRLARSFLVSVCVVDASGEMRTVGRGWGSLLRAALGRQRTGVMRRVG